MLVRAQTVMGMRSGLPKDVISNTMWFNTAAGIDLAEAAEAIQPNIEAFYLAAYTAISGSACMASYMAETTFFTNFYNQDAAPPRVPYRVDWGTFGASQGNTPIPTEVSCVLSYRGALENGVNPARRRGRIYLGGLGPATIAVSSGSSPYFPVFQTAFINQVIAAAEAQLLSPTDWGGTVPDTDITWNVHSDVSGLSVPVTAGWVDNTPDTQRRRGVNATSRTTFP